MSRVRILVHLRAPEGDQESLRAAYAEIGWTPGGIPGLLTSELLQDVDRPGDYALLGEWEDLESYRAWQLGPEHVDKPSALRPFQDRSRGRHYALYRIEAADSSAVGH